MEKPFEEQITQSDANAGARLGASAPNAAHCIGVTSDDTQATDTNRTADTPRTVIRGESPTEERKKSQAALTDWLNVSFPFHPENNNPLEFFKSFGEATKGIFGGMTDQQRGLHGWQYSFKFDHGCVFFCIRRPK